MLLRTIVWTLALAVASLNAADGRKAAYVSLLDEVLPQIADGGGWRTTLTLVNHGDDEARYTVTFHDANGAALRLSLVGIGVVSTYSGRIAVNGSVVLQTSGTGELRQGWAYVDQTVGRIAGMAIFGQTNPDTGRTQEAVVSLTTWSDDDFSVPFDNTGGFVTALALCHARPERFASSTTATAAFYDEQGSRIHLDQITLQPGQRLAFATADRWPELAGKRGTMRFTTPGLYLSALGLRFNPGGSFTSVHTLSR
jgi:hypothetical protein